LSLHRLRDLAHSSGAPESRSRSQSRASTNTSSA
jgi:hypothetical protein